MKNAKKLLAMTLLVILTGCIKTTTVIPTAPNVKGWYDGEMFVMTRHDAGLLAAYVEDLRYLCTQ